MSSESKWKSYLEGLQKATCALDAQTSAETPDELESFSCLLQSWDVKARVVASGSQGANDLGRYAVTQPTPRHLRDVFKGFDQLLLINSQVSVGLAIANSAIVDARKSSQSSLAARCLSDDSDRFRAAYSSRKGSIQDAKVALKGVQQNVLVFLNAVERQIDLLEFERDRLQREEVRIVKAHLRRMILRHGITTQDLQFPLVRATGGALGSNPRVAAEVE